MATTSTAPRRLDGDGNDAPGAQESSRRKNTVPPPAIPAIQTPPSPPATESDDEDTFQSPLPPDPPPRRPLFDDDSNLNHYFNHAPSHTNNNNSDHNHSIRRADTAPIVSSPPYWLSNEHTRNVSTSSIDTFTRGGIILRDNESGSITDSRNRSCWAKSVEITDYVVVNGSATNIGAFVVWNIRVETLTGSYMNIRKRYSEFDDFRWRLMRTFPTFEAAVPELPPKSLISKFRPRFLEKRRAGLQYFLNCILLNPEFSGSPVLKEFLFS